MLWNIWQEKWFGIHIKLPHSYDMYPLLRPSVLFFLITQKNIITSLCYTHQNKKWNLSFVMMTIDQICRCLIALHFTTTNLHTKRNSRNSAFWAHCVAKHSQVISVWSHSNFLLCLQSITPHFVWKMNTKMCFLSIAMFQKMWSKEMHRPLVFMWVIVNFPSNVGHF